MRRDATNVGLFVLVLVALLVLVRSAHREATGTTSARDPTEAAPSIQGDRTTTRATTHVGSPAREERVVSTTSETAEALETARDAGISDAGVVVIARDEQVVPRVSAGGGESIAPDVENTCAVDVELFWVDYEGNERSYGLLEAGVATALSTFRGHVWRARDLAGVEVRAFSASEVAVALCDDAHLPSRSAPLTRAPAPSLPDASPRSIQRASLTITNTCDEPLAITWVHFDGTERPYGVLGPGEVREQASFEGHLFRARREDGTLVASMVASGESRVGLCGEATDPDA